MEWLNEVRDLLERYVETKTKLEDIRNESHCFYTIEIPAVLQNYLVGNEKYHELLRDIETKNDNLRLEYQIHANRIRETENNLNEYRNRINQVLRANCGTVSWVPYIELLTPRKNGNIVDAMAANSWERVAKVLTFAQDFNNV